MNQSFAEVDRMRRYCLVAGLLASFLTGVLFTWSVLQAPVVEQLGGEALKATIVLGYTLQSVFSTTGSALFGSLTRRLGARRTIMLGALMMGLGYIIAGRTSSIPVFFLTFGFITGTGDSFIYLSYMGHLSSLYPERRGMISGLVAGAFGGSAIVWAPLMANLVEMGDIAAAFLVFGLVTLLAVLPGALLVQPVPEGYEEYRLTVAGARTASGADVGAAGADGARAVGAGAGYAGHVSGGAGTDNASFASAAPSAGAAFDTGNAGTGYAGTAGGSARMSGAGGSQLTRGEALRTSTFYFALISLICGCTSGNICMTQISSVMQESFGLAATAAAAYASLMSFMSMIGRFIWGGSADRIDRLKIMAALTGIPIFAMGVLVFCHGQTVTVACMALTAFCFGGIGGTLLPIAAELFGTRHASENFSLLYICFGFAGLIGPQLAVRLSRGGDYTFVFAAATLISLTAFIFAYLTRRHTPAH